MRALLIAEAELGERLMRALILRRTQMLQEGVGGPVIVGRSENPNVLPRVSCRAMAPRACGSIPTTTRRRGP
jgi:hypothetical protein